MAITRDELDAIREASTGALLAKRHIERKFGEVSPYACWARALYAVVHADAERAVLEWIEQLPEA